MPLGEMLKPVMFTGAAPSLIKVALCVLLKPGTTFPRFRLAVVKTSAPAPPVPLRAIVCCGLPGSCL